MSGWTLPPAGECDLWLLPVRRVDQVPFLGALLDPAERDRAARFPTGAARDVFVTSRAVQRLAGAGYLGRAAGELEFTRDCPYCPGQHGRPRIVGSSLEYSVSHTAQWLVLAVTADGRIGADVESRTSLRDVDALARVVLGPAEMTRSAGARGSDRARDLLRAWTRKEAAMKLTGFGLRAPAPQLDVGGAVLRVGDVPGWPEPVIHLYQQAAPPGHALALATTRPLHRVRRPDAGLLWAGLSRLSRLVGARAG